MAGCGDRNLFIVAGPFTLLTSFICLTLDLKQVVLNPHFDPWELRGTASAEYFECYRQANIANNNSSTHSEDETNSKYINIARFVLESSTSQDVAQLT